MGSHSKYIYQYIANSLLFTSPAENRESQPCSSIVTVHVIS